MNKKSIAQSIISLSNFIVKHTVGKSLTILGYEVSVPKEVKDLCKKSS